MIVFLNVFSYLREISSPDEIEENEELDEIEENEELRLSSPIRDCLPSSSGEEQVSSLFLEKSMKMKKALIYNTKRFVKTIFIYFLFES